MKLISWNVNGLRAVMSKDTLLPFIAAEDPDIMAFQETKMHDLCRQGYAGQSP